MSALTPEQAEAVELRELDVFCEAGAGTGKTKVLTERFAAAICDDGVELGEMLAFTFTERAADQLRGRVRGALRARAREAAEAGDEDRSLELKRLVRDTEAAWISTIHGFCRRLLAAHPVAAGVDPRFRVLDEGEAMRLRGRAFWAALEDLLSSEEPEAASRIVAAATPRGLRGIVVSAYDELRSRGEDAPALPDPPPVDPTGALRKLGEAAEEALAECENVTGQAAATLDRFARARELADAAAAGEVPSLDDVIPVELKSKADRFSGDGCERYRKAWLAARRCLAQVELADSYELVRELLGGYGRRYDEAKAERSGLDFEDLQLRARDLLRDHDAIRERYCERFRHLLVDEFQDTNEVQRDLVRLLQGPETRLFCVGDELQSIYGFRHADLAVFRSERERFREMDPERGRVVRLTGNFRAGAGVLAAVNAVGDALIDAFEPLTIGSERQAESDLVVSESPVDLLLTAADKDHDWDAAEVGLDLDEDEPAQAYRVAEARLLAAHLDELRRRGVPRGEMVVLLRSYTWVDVYERALAEAGLAPHVVGGRGYWSQQQIEDVLALLAVIANPLDDEAVLGALSSPFCGVAPDTLWLLRKVAQDRRARQRSARLWPAVRELVLDDTPADSEGRRWADAIDSADRDRLARLLEGIEPLREETPLLGIEGTIEAVCRRFGYDLATLMRDRGTARWANVRKLMRLARKFEANDGADLRGFLAYAADETMRAGEGEAPIAAEEHDGVRIMTVHGAKGLEFEVVAVPELGRRLLAGFTPAIRIGTIEPTGDEDGSASPIRIGLRLARLGRPSERLFDLDELEERSRAEEAAEELRLAHVAATRAKRKLVLSGTFNPGRDGKKELVEGSPVTERLVAGLGENELGELIAADEPAGAEMSVSPAQPRPGLDANFDPGRIAIRLSLPAAGAGAALAAASAAEEAAVEPDELPSPPLLALEPPPGSGARLSYSALSQYATCGYRFFVERELGLGAVGASAPLSPGATADEGGEDREDPSAREVRFGFGNAVHGLLEWSARNRLRPPGEQRIRRMLGSEGIGEGKQEVARAEEMIGGWLESPLCAELRAAGVELHPEEPFLLRLGGTLIRGSIDLLARVPDGGLIVVDYKTDRLDRAPAELIHRYSVQRDIYALAAGGGAPIRTGYVFLERPADPVELEFGAEGLERARADVEALLEGIASRRFEVTHRPHAALCADCPARERLCSHSPDHTLREAPDPAVAPEGREAAPGEGGDGPEQHSLVDA